MKKLLLLLMLISTSACAGSVEVRLLKNYDGIDAELKPYVQEFIYASEGTVTKRDFRGFSIGFRDYDGGNIVGTCHPAAFEVDISRTWWKSEWHTQDERIELVFHELGHCILRRGHTKKPTRQDFAGWLERFGFAVGMFKEKVKLPDGCPSSFMHPYTISDTCVGKHFSYYINELFKGKVKNYVEKTNIGRRPNHKLKCKRPTIINKTKTWVKRDEDTYRRAKKTCVKRYHGCLTKFYKKTQSSYAAICS